MNQQKYGDYRNFTQFHTFQEEVPGIFVNKNSRREFREKYDNKCLIYFCNA